MNRAMQDVVVRNRTSAAVKVAGVTIPSGDTATFRKKTLTELQEGTDATLLVRPRVEKP